MEKFGWEITAEFRCTLPNLGRLSSTQKLRLATSLFLPAVLRIRDLVRFDPWIRHPGKKSRSGSRMNIPDQIPRAQKQFFGLKILEFFDADPGTGIFLTLDPGLKNLEPGSAIRDKHAGSATLLTGMSVTGTKPTSAVGDLRYRSTLPKWAFGSWNRNVYTGTYQFLQHSLGCTVTSYCQPGLNSLFLLQVRFRSAYSPRPSIQEKNDQVIRRLYSREKLRHCRNISCLKIVRQQCANLRPLSLPRLSFGSSRHWSMFRI